VGDRARLTIDHYLHSANATVAELRELLIDESKPMFHRYGAMFALRDIGSEEAVDVRADTNTTTTHAYVCRCVTVEFRTV